MQTHQAVPRPSRALSWASPGALENLVLGARVRGNIVAMPALPEGVLTLFFSDVEGSTRLAKSHGDAAWAELLETHRRLLRQAFAAHGGVEVDTQGDSFFVVFRMASDAVAAALAAQRSLAAQAWPSAGAVRVRIGLHTGEAIARGDHYVGQEIHRASRICDAGHGGQIVVSQTTAELVRGSLPEGATLTPLGDYRLKDLGQAQRLFQLDAAGLASDFPRLRSLDIPTNLPTERSSFIGRAADISAIRERLAGAPAGHADRHRRLGQDAPGAAGRRAGARPLHRRRVLRRPVAGQRRAATGRHSGKRLRSDVG